MQSGNLANRETWFARQARRNQEEQLTIISLVTCLPLYLQQRIAKGNGPTLSTIPTFNRERSGGLQRISDSVILSWGWSRRLLAFFSGAVGVVALPPFGFIPAMAVSLTLAIWLLDGSSLSGSDNRRVFASSRAAFAIGWIWGFGYFLFGLWWLGAAFLVEADKFAWALPLGVIALPAALALFPAIAFSLAQLFWSPGYGRILIFGLAVFACEWLRSIIFTGFPWNEIGMAFGQNLWLAQIASLFGLHGLTLLTIVLLSAPATITDVRSQSVRLAPTLFSSIALMAMLFFGVYRTSGPPAAFVPAVKLRIVQPNIAQGAEFTAENGIKLLEGYIALSDRATSPDTPGIAEVTHLIWPESAFPFILSREPKALAKVSAFLRGGVTLITGAARAEESGNSENTVSYYNSIQIIGSDGALGDHYDKRHLVPFGEYVPFYRELKKMGISQFVRLPGGFSSGTTQPLLHIPGLPSAVALICYEAIFPQESGTLGAEPTERGGWILNVTDDAWFGLTPGPYQHFEQARLRAIEQGLPLVRAANSGISAVTDGFGRIIAQLPLGIVGVIDSGLPVTAPRTPFSSAGRLAPIGLAVALLLFLFLLQVRKLVK